MTSKEEFLKLCNSLKKYNKEEWYNKYDCIEKYIECNDSEHLYYNGIDLTNIYKDLIKAELFDKLKEVFKKVTYAPFAINNNGKIEPVPTAKLAEDFDKELFRQVLEQCRFEIKEK